VVLLLVAGFGWAIWQSKRKVPVLTDMKADAVTMPISTSE
jgi:hypothetical protein